MGATFAALGTLGSAIVIAADLGAWFPETRPEFHRYFLLRALLAVVMQSSIPMVQIAVAGLVGWLAARRKSRGIPTLANPDSPNSFHIDAPDNDPKGE